jgi:hypothetical protein
MAKIRRPTDPVTPPVTPPPDPVVEPEPVDVPQITNYLSPLPISENSEYLRIGDYPRKAWSETLLANSPLRDDLDAILLASQGVGILAREQALKESSDGTDATARQARNPLGLMVRNANEPYILTGAGRKLRVFPTWADSFKEFKRRLTDPQEAYLSVGVKTLGQFIERYLMGWIPGNPNHAIPAGEALGNLQVYKDQVITRANTRIEKYGRTGEVPPEPTDPQPHPLQGFKKWDIPGLGSVLLPESITVEVILTQVGVHRPGRKVTMTGSTLHETGNRGATAGARMHSNWQDGCTQGHPNGYVGVSMYVENRLVIVKIPFDEASIHSGDWRNNAHPSMEVCVNASRNAEQTEDTAMWIHAAILHARGQNAEDHLYPHGNAATGCPAIIMSQGRWPQIERGVDERIAILKTGGNPVPVVDYAESFPVPKEWDGTDYVREEDDHRFYALQRVFVTNKVTGAYQSADPKSPKVRRDLNKGEPFLSHYITEGVGGMWLVSQFGSRIMAADCSPRLGILIGANWVGDMHTSSIEKFAAADEPTIILNEPDRGLSAADVPEDAPALDKQAFMQTQ